jgi:hypothetical protein
MELAGVRRNKQDTNQDSLYNNDNNNNTIYFPLLILLLIGMLA